MDDDIAFKATIARLRRDGVDVTRSDDVGMRGREDSEHLAFARSVNRTVVTGNQGDFLRLRAEWVAAGHTHSGIVILDRQLSIGEQMRALGRIREQFTQESMANACLFAANWLQDQPPLPPDLALHVVRLVFPLGGPEVR